VTGAFTTASIVSGSAAAPTPPAGPRAVSPIEVETLGQHPDPECVAFVPILRQHDPQP
jgi:hypothetical protein